MTPRISTHEERVDHLHQDGSRVQMTEIDTRYDKPEPGMSTHERVMQCQCGITVIVAQTDKTIESA